MCALKHTGTARRRLAYWCWELRARPWTLLPQLCMLGLLDARGSSRRRLLKEQPKAAGSPWSLSAGCAVSQRHGGGAHGTGVRARAEARRGAERALRGTARAAPGGRSAAARTHRPRPQGTHAPSQIHSTARSRTLGGRLRARIGLMSCAMPNSCLRCCLSICIDVLRIGCSRSCNPAAVSIIQQRLSCCCAAVLSGEAVPWGGDSRGCDRHRGHHPIPGQSPWEQGGFALEATQEQLGC